MTHAFNQDQRYVSLAVVCRSSGQIMVDAPADSNAAPPGYYLLFILKNGVPSVARWVRVNRAKGLDTCDGVGPAAVTDLTVVPFNRSATVTWTAPGDDGNCGSAQVYELRYSSAPITEANFASATLLQCGDPGPPLTLHCAEFTCTPCPAACGSKYFAVKTWDDRNNGSFSNVASTSVPCTGQIAVCGGGEGLMAQGWGDGGWAPENSLLWESPLAGAIDLYRLKGTAGPVEGLYRARLVKVGAGWASLDQISLGAVDHDPGLRAFARADRVFLGTTSAVARATDDSGGDVTGVVTGSSGPPYVGEEGRILTVELAASASSNTALVVESAGYAAGVSADSSGILVQKPESGGSWKTIAHVHPRRTFDPQAVDAESSATLRLVFLRQHSIRSLDRLAVTKTETPVWLTLAAAQHSRLGDVAGAVGSSGGTTTLLLPGDDLSVSFGATPVTSGTVRDLFLLVRGGYSSLSTTSPPRTAAERSAAGAPPAFEFALGLARPNPTSGEIHIGYSLARDAEATLRLYDVAGRLLRTLASGKQAAGPHEVLWDGRDGDQKRVPPGVYFYRMTSAGWQSQRKIVIVAR